MIKIKNVYVEYQTGVKALTNINISIKKGEFAFIVGTTGSGKSTLLRLLYREMLPTDGIIMVGDIDITALKISKVPYFRRTLGIVFQDFKLLPQKKVWENLAFSLRAIGLSRREIKQKIETVLDLVGLQHRSDAFPHQLSGGEQQRAAIARALANNPDILIADEPTGNLDPDTSWGIMSLLDEVNKNGTTVIVATHDNAIVDKMKKRVIQLEDGIIIRDEDEGMYRSDS